MGPGSRTRGGQRQLELDLAKYVSLLNMVPDEVTMGRLQDSLETLLSERSHPMIMALSKQRDQLKRANDVIGHEMELRKSKKLTVFPDGDERPSKKRRRSQALDADHSESEQIADVEIGNTAATKQGSADNISSGRITQSHEEARQLNRDDGIESNVFEDAKHDVGLTIEDISQSTALQASKSQDDTEGTADDVGFIKSHPEQRVPLHAASRDSLNSGTASPKSHNEDADKELSEHSEGNSEIAGEVDANDATTKPDNTHHKNTAEKALVSGTSENPAGNNKFVTNPKSEYVATQSLPVHTFSVFKEGDEENEDEEAYKRRLGVVSYPKEDLSTLTAGPVPMDDYTRAKPSNQVQFSTYATFLEPYFRPFTEEDIQFLQQPAVGAGVEAVNLKTGKKMSPYVFPPLGPHYHHNWAVQDAELSGVEVSPSTRKAYEAQIAELTKVYDAAGGVNDLADSNLETSPAPVSLGPLTERLIAAVISEAQDPSESDTQAGVAGSAGSTPSTGIFVEKTAAAVPPPSQNIPQITDFTDLEERVKNEFRYVGVLDMGHLRQFEQRKSEFKLAAPKARDEFSDPAVTDIDWVNGSEDDEISRELRFLQSRLKEVSRRNAMYKSQLLPVIQEQLSWQEYQSILQDLDKQVDQAYLKRQKTPQLKQKKKKGTNGVDSPYESHGNTPQPGVAFTPDSSKYGHDHKPTIKALIDKRERWVSKIGPLFRPAHEMMREYETPKFIAVDEDDEDEEDEDEDRDERL